MDDIAIVLECVNCEEPRDYEIVKEASDGNKIVDCKACGKRHSQDSLTVL
jgi:uncharacterized Zn finger protein